MTGHRTGSLFRSRDNSIFVFFCLRRLSYLISLIILKMSVFLIKLGNVQADIELEVILVLVIRVQFSRAEIDGSFLRFGLRLVQSNLAMIIRITK